MSTTGWTPNSPLLLWESLTYTQQVEAIAANLGVDARRMDDALWAVTNGIAVAPEEFNLVIENVRVARTRAYEGVPELRIFFTIQYDVGSCTLEWIELVT